MSRKSLYLVDVSSYVFRAYYAIRALSTSYGVATNATYGTVTMLLKLIREMRPDYFAVIFDSPVPSFRKDIYQDYKANREVPPEDLPAQFEHVREFVTAYPLPFIQMNRFEADDIIASVVNSLSSEKNLETIIVSTDKDLMQLVNPRVSMFDSMRDRKIGPKEVEEKFGVGPGHVLDVLALAGDASDNIPGVKGVGQKTASKLIHEWGSLDQVLKRAGEIGGKLGESLKIHKNDAILSKRLAELRNDLEINKDLSFYSLFPPNQINLNKFYHKLEFNKLIEGETGSRAKGTTVKNEERHYELILSQGDFQRWVERLKKAKGGFSFDTETTSTDPMRARLVGLSFADGVGQACYIPLTHSYLGCPEQLTKKYVLSEIRPFLEDPQRPKWAQNGKYDMKVLYQEGITVVGLVEDTLVASYLLNPEGQHNLDYLSKEYLGLTTIHYDEVVPKGETFDQVPLDQACRYSAEDADMATRLVAVLGDLLTKRCLRSCYQEIEIPLIEVLFRMETHGVLVDSDFLKELSREFKKRLKRLEEEIYKEAHCEFNLHSPKQLAALLFSTLKLPTQRRTKTGYSTDVDVLTKLKSLHPVPGLLMQHRELSKLESTYVEQLTQLIHPQSGRIHTNYNQAIAATGRLSSSDPNLQNIPIRTEEGRRIRQAFKAPPGFQLVSADYSQIELRLLAAFSKDLHLMKAFSENKDIHRMTAEKVFGKGGEAVDARTRAMAKTVNFGILYGQSPFGLSQMLEIPQPEAKKYIDEFYAQYPSVLEYRKEVLNEATKTGEVRTWQGRRRLIPDLKSQNRVLRNNAERTAFNTIFQGSAADLIKVAMIKIDGRLRGKGLASKMIMQVHDELVFEVPEAKVEEVSQMVKEEMENAIPCEVPLKVDLGIGKNWAEAH